MKINPWKDTFGPRTFHHQSAFHCLQNPGQKKHQQWCSSLIIRVLFSWAGHFCQSQHSFKMAAMAIINRYAIIKLQGGSLRIYGCFLFRGEKTEKLWIWKLFQVLLVEKTMKKLHSSDFFEESGCGLAYGWRRHFDEKNGDAKPARGGYGSATVTGKINLKSWFFFQLLRPAREAEDKTRRSDYSRSAFIHHF